MQLQLTMQLLPPFCNSVYAFCRDLVVIDNEYFPGNNDGRLEERARTNMYCTKCFGTSLITRHKTLSSDKRPRVRGIFSDMLKMSQTHHLPSVRQKQKTSLSKCRMRECCVGFTSCFQSIMQPEQSHNRKRSALFFRHHRHESETLKGFACGDYDV